MWIVITDKSNNLKHIFAFCSNFILSIEKPLPPQFTPRDLGNLVDGEAVGMNNGQAITCYSGHGLPPPSFKWYLGKITKQKFVKVE